ncbi:MAG: hypothetical protein SGI96_20770 [Bacteroidota bacterium]|nr:hypothetical protein [Bacteroidota bacterium]
MTHTHFSKKCCIKLLLVVCIFTFSFNSYSQNLDYNSKVTFALTDGSSITLYAQLSGSGSTAVPLKNYYYLPTQVQLARDAQTQVPEFLFLKYITDQREDQGGVSGALIHFLMQVKFTPQQLAEIQSKLVAKVPGALVKGPVNLFATGDANSFTITSAIVNTTSGMTKSLVTSGKAPLQEGGKIAVASNLDKNGAQLLAATFEKTSSITDLSVNLFYKYYLVMNGLKAKFTIDYKKIHEINRQDSINAKRERGGWWLWSYDKSQTWTEIHTMYERLVEKKAITIEITEGEGVSPEKTAKITEALFQLFLTSVATPATTQPQVSPMTEQEKQNLPGKNTARNYQLNIITNKKLTEQRKDVITLNYNFAMPMELSITQNLKSFYDAARDNPKCIGNVILNDEFYKRMDMQFVLDGEAVDMFEKEINYANVKARRKSTTGSGYVEIGDHTFNRTNVADKGTVAVITHAPGAGANREMFEYKTQWSMKGGFVYPAEPKWQQGQMTAITVAPPVSPRLVEFEADLEKLKASDITRATLQVRYSKFGQEMEENLQISPVQAQALVNKTIYTDKDTRGYVYRLILNHTTEGKLALPWSVKVNDNYVYAVIPDDFSNKTSELFIKAIDAAKTIVNPGADGKVTADKILDQFKEVLQVVKTN